MSIWLAAVLAIAAVSATYIFCVRPMWHGHAQCGIAAGVDQRDAELDRQIAELREELRILRAEPNTTEVLDDATHHPGL